MLEPQTRELLLDALRPPPGYELDRALGTTYSLDLLSLLAAPLGFALLDREATDGRLVADPVALLQAVRSNADRIDIFCQADKIGVPRQHRAILTYLEASVHQVVPPNPKAIFHPKVWVIRYRRADGQMTYRLLCLSRNLTSDRSWDTVLKLDGEKGSRGQVDGRLSVFVAQLPKLAIHRIGEERANAIHQLSEELRSVVFAPPDGFERLAFWPLGLGPHVWPFRGVGDRLLVISPFLTAGCVARFGRKGARDIIVSRPEAFDLVGANALAGFQELLVLSPAVQESTDRDAYDAIGAAATASIDEAVAESPSGELSGLHAKLYVADMPGRARVWTGSANATDAAFNGNVEFLVEMEGPKASFGIDAVVGDRKDGIGLRKFLEPYKPGSDLPRELTAAEQLGRRLDDACRALAQSAFVATVGPANSDIYTLNLKIGSSSGQGPAFPMALQEMEVRVRPLTMGSAYFQTPVYKAGIATIDFGTVSFAGLTSFFVVQVQLGESHHVQTAEFVANAELLGAPEDRTERTLVSLLQNRRDLLRLLALLLGVLDGDDLSAAVDVMTGDSSPQQTPWVLVRWQAVLEPMVRALASDPQRLDEVDRLLTELGSTEDGRRLLPPGWREVWEPIWETRQTLHRP